MKYFLYYDEKDEIRIIPESKLDLPDEFDSYQINSFTVHFEAVDGQFKKRVLTPSGAIKLIESRIGSLNLPGYVSEDGIVRSDGITANYALRPMKRYFTTGEFLRAIK